MTAEERSEKLRQEADELLGFIHLQEHCSNIGEIIPTGSYLLDVMMYPDIDLYIPPTTPENLLMVAAQLSRYDCVESMNFKKGGPGDLETGLYLKPYITRGSWERSWKIDIWSLPNAVIERNQARLIDLKNRMTSSHRHLILDFKWQLLNSAGRTPMFSGIFIYQAVIDHGMTELGQVVRFLKENGIEV